MVTVAAPGAGASPTPTWTDTELAGALNDNGYALVTSVSCTSATSCVAGGSYADSNSDTQAFVSVLSGTTWTDTKVAGALNTGGTASVASVSCTSATSCVAGGQYEDSYGNYQAFVSVLSGTTWTDTEVAGALNTGGAASVGSVSCTSATSCVAGGQYVDSNGNYQAFVSVFNGTTWTDTEVAGALNTGGVATVTSVSCTSATSCVAGGQYEDSDGYYQFQAFVSVFNGTTWTDTEVAGALNASGNAASVNSVSCTSATSCVAGGNYEDSNHKTLAFVSVLSGTTWTDTEVAGALNTGGNAAVNSVSCTSATSCVAGGSYTDSNSKTLAFVSVFNGTTWTDTELAGALNTSGNAHVNSVSCTSATSCVAGGYYRNNQAFVSVFDGTTWTDSVIAPLSNEAFAYIFSVSCTSATSCVVGGLSFNAFVSALGFPAPSTPSTPSISNLPTSAAYGGSFTPTVVTTGDGATSATSSTTSVCTVDPTSGLVSYVGAGTCTLDAHVAAGTNFTSADGTDQSFTVVAAKPSVPGAPSLTDNHGSISLTWSAPSSDGGATVTYKVEEQTNHGTWSEVVTGLTSPTYTYQGTTAKSTYSFAIVAVNSAGRSAWSTAVWVKAAPVKPSVPGTPVLVDHHGSYSITWSASTNNGGDTVTYKVEELTNKGSWSQVATGLTSPTYTYQGTTAKSTYSFAIVAANSAGQSAWSPAAYLRAS